MPPTVLVFANPSAGRGRASVLAEGIAARLRDRGHAVRLLLDQFGRAGSAPGGAEDVAVVLGGDGTLREVARGLLPLPDAQRPAILHVPLGTANLMAQHLALDGLSRRLDAIAPLIEARHTRLVDVAHADGRIFLLMAGVGLDAEVVHGLARVRNGPIRKASYVVPALRALGGHRFPRLRVEVDDVPVFGPGRGMAFVGNVPEYGTGFPILDRARSDDGLLDVCILPCSSRRQVLEQFLAVASGLHRGSAGFVHRQGKRVRIDADEPVAVQLDGEEAGHTPVTCELRRERLRFIVAPSSGGGGSGRHDRPA